MRKLVLLFVALAVVLPSAFASTAFSVDNYWTDHAVVQRDKPVRILGNAQSGQTVQLQFAGRSVTTIAANDGRWKVELPPMKAGGPYTLLITRPFRLEFTDILVGDVWIASGQSNMQYHLDDGEERFYKHPHGPETIRKAADHGLRVRYSTPVVNVTGPCTDFAQGDGWQVGVGHEALGRFSALAYFYGKNLREALDHKVPVGVIDASWGGTMIEPWIPLEGFRAGGRRDVVAGIEAQIARVNGRTEAELAAENEAVFDELKTWVSEKFLKVDPARSAKAVREWSTAADTDGWKRGARADMTALQRPGIAWYRFELDFPDGWQGADLLWHMDSVSDCDETYLDGKKIGETGVQPGEYWAMARDYRFKVAEKGRHVIAVRAMNHYTNGGILGHVYLKNVDSGEFLEIADERWMEKVEYHIDEKKIGVRPTPPNFWGSVSCDPQTPTTLFNAMLAPAANVNIRGFIWYQGCSNAHLGEKYADIQKLQIDAYRKVWRDPELPFLITQISAFHAHRPYDRLADDFWKTLEPADCVGFAPLRKGQDIASRHPFTGLACTIDIGDHSDIHPWDKETVAKRLVNEAMRISYGHAECLPGPRFASMKAEGAKVRVAFRDVGGGLELRGKRLNPHLVALAAEDGVYHWGEGVLEGNELVVWAEGVEEPTAVRYCFSSYPPDVNLFRKDGYPVFPFEERIK